MSIAEAEVKGLETLRVLVEQIAEVLRWLVRGRNRQQHRRAEGQCQSTDFVILT
jgi:hypothetical protein